MGHCIKAVSSQVALAKCLGDGECLENLACLNLCNGKKDETECQVETLIPACAAHANAQVIELKHKKCAFV